MPAPFDLVVTRADGKTERLHQTAALWSRNGHEATIPLRGAGVKSVKAMKTAKIDSVQSDTTPIATPEDEVGHVDGGTK